MYINPNRGVIKVCISYNNYYRCPYVSCLVIIIKILNCKITEATTNSQ